MRIPWRSSPPEVQDSPPGSGTPPPGTGARRRRGRRCLTLPGRSAAQALGGGGEDAEEEDGEAAVAAPCCPALRRARRCRTAPAVVRRQPLKWADPNACQALLELALDDRRSVARGDTSSRNAAPALCGSLIASFLRFDEPLPNMLYVFGGRNQTSTALDTVEMFDAWHGHWVACQPLPSPRVSSTAAVLPSGGMLLVGGYDGRGMVDGLLASCEVFDPCSGRWRQNKIASLKRARWGHGCAALNGKVYVVGGCSLAPHARPAVTAMETLRSCEVYDPEEDTWTEIASLQVPRSGARVVAVGGRFIVAVGGCDDIFGREEHLTSVEIYSPEAGVWTLLERKLEHPRPIAGVAAIDGEDRPGQVLIVGGAAALSSVECYEVRHQSGGCAMDEEQGEAHRVATGAGLEQVERQQPYLGGLPDAPEGRMGCQATGLLLPGRGKSFPHNGSHSVVVVGGELWGPPGRHRSPQRVDFSTILVFDVESGTWRSDEVVPPMPTARTAVALCVGQGYAWKANEQP